MIAESRGRIGSVLFALMFVAGLVGAACRKSNSASPPLSPATTQQISAPTPLKPDAVPVKIQSQIGFASRRKLLEHYEKHGREFGSISPEEYLRLAQLLRDRPATRAGGDVLEIVRSDSVVTRFDRATGAFLAFDPDLTIRTFFKPNDGEAYFRRQAKRSRN